MTNPLTELTTEQLRTRHSVKWRQYPPEVLPLWVAEMDTPLAPPIQDALSEAVAAGDTGYAHVDGLGEAFAGFAARRLRWSPDPAHMRLVPDVMRGLTEVLRLAGRPGDGVVVNTPAYPPFFWVIANAGRRVVESPLQRDASGAYRLDLDRLDRDLADPGVAVYLLCHPHNPTGLVLGPAELAAVAELAARHRVQLLVDEIHAPLAYPGSGYAPMATVDSGGSAGVAGEAVAGAVTFVSASKAFNLPGLKAALAVAVGPPAWRLLTELPIEIGYGASLFGVLAGQAAFTAGDAWLDALLAALDTNRRLLGELLRAHLPEVGYAQPQATYLAWLDLRRLELGDDPAAALVSRAKVALTAGPPFGEPGRGHARLNFATSPQRLAEAVTRIAVALGR
jgi:cysteine-S-conjugate beta-lyase